MINKEVNFSRWCKINADWEQSGLTQREYCARNGLNLKSFENWRHRIRTRTEAVSPINVVELGQTVDVSSLFSIQASSSGSGVHIRRGDIHVDLEDRFSTEALCRVLEVLRSL